MSNQSWSFANIWNESLLQREEREIIARDYLWATDLGKSTVDAWLALKGEKPTNPPDARALRKFEAGNIWEWIMKLILIRAGILHAEQVHVSHQYEGLLKVTGRLDYIAGGTVDYEKGIAQLDDLLLPSLFKRAGENIITHFKEKYPDGLKKTVLEIKSTSAFMFEVYEKIHKAGKNHRMQAFHYVKSDQTDTNEAHIVYVSKDDCRIAEYGVLNPSSTETEYKEAIARVTAFYNANEMPPLEPLIVWDDDLCSFQKNWKVEYSPYLTKLYGFENQGQFFEIFSKKATSWKRVMKRVVDGAKMTSLNNEVIDEIKKSYPNFDELVDKVKAKKKTSVSDSEQEDDLPF